jgi:hypothetical protein
LGHLEAVCFARWYGLEVPPQEMTLRAIRDRNATSRSIKCSKYNADKLSKSLSVVQVSIELYVRIIEVAWVVASIENAIRK